MSYQENPLEAIESDLNDVNKELDCFIKIKDAIDVALCNNPEQIERSMFPTVFDAIKVIVGANLESRLKHCNLNKLTLENTGHQIDAIIEAVQEERDSFIAARNELYVWNREKTIDWIQEQIEVAQRKLDKTDQATVANYGYRAEIDTFKQCLRQLNNVEAKYDI